MFGKDQAIATMLQAQQLVSRVSDLLKDTPEQAPKYEFARLVLIQTKDSLRDALDALKKL